MQSDLHTLLTAAPLDLGAHDLEDIVLESPAGQRRRIDVEVGFTVFEVKRDLRVGNVRHDAVVQLAGNVQSRTHDLQQRYVGVLTDGAEWHLYHLIRGDLTHISSHLVDPTTPDVDALCIWLEGVLGTAEKITPTPLEIERRLGSTSPSHALDFAQLADPSLAEAVEHLTQTAGAAVDHGAPISPWADRFSEGAAIGPRVLMMIEDAPASPLGSGAGRKPVRSQRSTNEKAQWKQLPSMNGSVELQFLRPVHLGESILPHRVGTPARAVIPWDGTPMLDVDHKRLDDYPGLAAWTRAISETWIKHRTSTLSLAESVDYRGKLSGQLPTAARRVVYTKSGMYSRCRSHHRRRRCQRRALLGSLIVHPGSAIPHGHPEQHWPCSRSSPRSRREAAGGHATSTSTCSMHRFPSSSPTIRSTKTWYSSQRMPRSLPLRWRYPMAKASRPTDESSEMH